ncbi:MAG: citrate lyase subunit alpha [Thermoplasmata archaeon]|nr:MAG: citrate lyase subunit alpha [Thermoplasmata archaeon]
MKVKNAAGKEIETTISDQSFIPFKGGKKHNRDSKIVRDIETALRKCGFKSGMTISFHHQLRNGDYVVNNTFEAIKEIGCRGLRLAQTALFNVHKPIIDYIKEGVVTRIEGSVNGVVGDFISTNNPLESPVILRSHGGRWGAVKSGELHPDIAVIAASAADCRGNATGLIGESAFGNIAYSPVDAWHADKVIIVTDNIVNYPSPFREIYEGLVDYVVEIDQIGDPNKIVSGSLKITEDPMKLNIGKNCVDLMEAAGIVKNDMIFQAGAGGISLAALKYLGERLKEKNMVAGCSTGGLTEFIVNMYNDDILKQVNTCQCFDTVAVDFVRNHLEAISTIGEYSDHTMKGRNTDKLDAVILGATEVDTRFNVNVNTHSNGKMLHGIGGHQDVSATANLTIITVPVFRKSNPIVRELVTTISTPGDIIDAIVTDNGIAINPKRKDLIDKVSGKVKIVDIEDLKNIAYDQTGGPTEPVIGDEIVGITKYFDGTVLDNIYQVLGD